MLRDLKWLGLDWDEGILPTPTTACISNHGLVSRHLKHPLDKETQHAVTMFGRGVTLGGTGNLHT